MDGRSHPEKIDPAPYGHSIGHWEKDTLVVDSRGFSENFWLDRTGLPHTEQLHTVERFTRRDEMTLHYQVTIDDPGAYTKPWTAAWNLAWRPNAELAEYICQENNQYLMRLTDDFGQPLFGRKR